MSDRLTWVPGAGQRHASTASSPHPSHEFPAEINVSTVCGREVTSATGELPWLWPTCPDCDSETRRLAGVPGRDEIAKPSVRKTVNS